LEFDVVVVGAGLSGSVAAREFAERGKRVLVVERHRHVAGHCHDYRDDAGITVHTYGPHIFHTVDAEVWRYVRRFSEFSSYQHRVLSYADGNLVPFPINRLTINQVFGLALSSEEVAAFLEAEREASDLPETSANYRDAVVAQVGERLYAMFFRNYTRKQWNREPEELAPELAGRIPVRTNADTRYFVDPYQGLPLHGYTRLVENLLDHPGISLLLGADWFEAKDFHAPLTVFTGELDRFFDYRFGKLEYRSLSLDFRTLDVESFQEASVVNYPNDYEWTRITEFKKLTGERSPKTTILYEYPKAEGEPYYVVPSKTNTEMRERYMVEVKRLEEKGSHLFIGRLAEYKYYNMDQAIKSALSKARSVV
jgi:UDP-galactopyranose mutase